MMKKWLIPIISSIVAAMVSMYFYKDLPEMMAIHFNVNDVPDRYAGKLLGAFLMPVLVLVVTALVGMMTKLEPNEQKRERAKNSVGSMMAIVSVILLAVHCFTLAYNLGYEVSARLFAPLFVGVIFIAVGNIMPRMPQGTLRVFRMGENAYRRFARHIGRFMVGAGFLVIIAALMPDPFGMYAMFAIIAAFVVYSVGKQIHFARSDG